MLSFHKITHSMIFLNIKILWQKNTYFFIKRILLILIFVAFYHNRKYKFVVHLCLFVCYHVCFYVCLCVSLFVKYVCLSVTCLFCHIKAMHQYIIHMRGTTDFGNVVKHITDRYMKSEAFIYEGLVRLRLFATNCFYR